MGATNRKNNLTKKLASAACTLLGAVPAAKAGLVESWNVDSAVLFYSEAAGRVSAVEPVLNVNKEFSGNRKLNLKFTLDVLTGATPNGAVPTRTPQTFTRPSGSASYVVPANTTPLDDTFHDSRMAFNASWQQPIGRLSLLTLGGNFSSEFDFLSTGLNAVLAHDFNERNTTVTLGLSFEGDSVDPVGGAPVPLAAMAPVGASQPRKNGTQTKHVTDALLGVTQVLGPKTLTQINYSLSRTNGYLNDPYKVLSVVDPNTGATLRNIYEDRPGTRTKQAIYWMIRQHLKRDIVSGSYRFFHDDWGVKSQTVDLTYNWKPSVHWWLEPHVRFYTQSAADFYHVQLLDNVALPSKASSDYRLAAYKGYTFGFSTGWKFENETMLIVKLEYYTTRGNHSPAGILPSQQGLDFYPDLKATIFQVQYRF